MDWDILTVAGTIGAADRVWVAASVWDRVNNESEKVFCVVLCLVFWLV